MSTINIYCDESCHLERDRQQVMVLGAIWCPIDKKSEIFKRIIEIKLRHDMNPAFEIKWTKVSKGKVRFYLDIIDYFFDDDDLHYRALIVPEKEKLKHELFGQTHDEFYYKMYFDLLKVILNPDSEYNIYLDYKDTKGGEKVRKLHDVLCNNLYDFSRDIIKRIHTVQSKEVQLVQLADLLTGAISYINRDLVSNIAKKALIGRMRQRSHYSLKRTTLLLEQKLNIFRWHAKEGN
jgi:hypothetical protein